MSAHAGSEPLFDARFSAAVIEWRGPSPFLFVPVPAELVGELRHAARLASYGWGVVPVMAEISGFAFTTSLFPRDGGYLLPVKLAVQRATGAAADSRVMVRITVAG